MPIRFSTIDEFPSVRSPNPHQTEKRPPNGASPPLRRSTLTSKSFIRNDLQARTGARIAPAAVDALQTLVHRGYAALVHEVVACYRAEADLRELRGDEHRLTLRPRHVVPPAIWPSDWKIPAGEESR